MVLLVPHPAHDSTIKTTEDFQLFWSIKIWKNEHFNIDSLYVTPSAAVQRYGQSWFSAVNPPADDPDVYGEIARAPAGPRQPGALQLWPQEGGGDARG